MYGNRDLSLQHILLYGLSKEFLEYFSSLNYLGIELPLPLLRNFHLFIWPMVESIRDENGSARRLKDKYSLCNFNDVQKVLERKPPVMKDMSRESDRKTLAAQVHFLPFLLECFPHSNVLLILNSGSEEIYLRDRDLPPTYRICKAAEEGRAAHLNPSVVSNLLKECDSLLADHIGHPVFGQPKFRLWLRKHIPVSMKYIHVITRWVVEEPINLILSHTEMVNPGTTLSLVASQYNLPFVNAPLHIITDRNIIPTRASHFCAWGKNYRDWLIKRGIQPSRVSCTGNLRFEYEQKMIHADKNNLLTKFKIPQNHYIVIYTTQPLQDEVKLTLFKWILEAAAGLPLTVLLKRHSRDALNYKIMKETDNVVVVSESTKLYDLLPLVDFLTTVSSTTAIEAALLNKGIIVLQPDIPSFFTGNSTNYHAHLARANAGFQASSSKELQKFFSILCQSENARLRLQRKTERFLNNTIHKGASSTPSEDIRQLLQTIQN